MAARLLKAPPSLCRRPSRSRRGSRRGRRSGRRRRGSRRRYVQFLLFTSPIHHLSITSTPFDPRPLPSPLRPSPPLQAKAREEAIARGEFDPFSRPSRGGRGVGRGSTRGDRGDRGGGRGGRGGSTRGGYGDRDGGGGPASKRGRWDTNPETADTGYRGQPAPAVAEKEKKKERKDKTKSKGKRVIQTKKFGEVPIVEGGNPLEDFDSDPLSSSDNSDSSSDSDDSDSESDSDGSDDDDSSGSDIDPEKDAISSRAPPEEGSGEIGGIGEGRGKPCSYFLTPKGCSMGDRCRFVHDPSLLPPAHVCPFSSPSLSLSPL